jgi:hypothetical protein
MNCTVFLDTKYFDAKRMFKFEYELWAHQNNINFKQLLKYFLVILSSGMAFYGFYRGILKRMRMNKFLR